MKTRWFRELFKSITWGSNIMAYLVNIKRWLFIDVFFLSLCKFISCLNLSN